MFLCPGSEGGGEESERESTQEVFRRYKFGLMRLGKALSAKTW